MSSKAAHQPLKRKTSFVDKIKKFFNDVPENQNIMINEASIVRPPQVKKIQKAKSENQMDAKEVQVKIGELYQIHEELDKSEEFMQKY